LVGIVIISIAALHSKYSEWSELKIQIFPLICNYSLSYWQQSYSIFC
jgi:hypothetical protein